MLPRDFERRQAVVPEAFIFLLHSSIMGSFLHEHAVPSPLMPSGSNVWLICDSDGYNFVSAKIPTYSPFDQRNIGHSLFEPGETPCLNPPL